MSTLELGFDDLIAAVAAATRRWELAADARTRATEELNAAIDARADAERVLRDAIAVRVKEAMQ